MVSSAAPATSFPLDFAYSVGKAAVNHVANVGCRQLAGSGVRMNVVTPGPAPATAGTTALVAKSRDTAMAEVVNAVVFLGNSHSAGFVTGTNLEVTLGGTLAASEAAAEAAAQE